MSSVYLSDLVMKRESKSFIDSLHAVLRAAKLFEGPKYMLSGLTGMAFKFSVHERLLPMSVSAYGLWGVEHRSAVDNLGFWTMTDSGRTRHPTFQFYQQDMVEWIKESLDREIGVIYWIPEFGVIKGYDDEDHVFFVQNGYTNEDLIVLYDNLGLNPTPFWYCQTISEKVEISLKDMVLESLRLAIHDWDVPYKTLPSRDIASGKLAYSYLIQALKKGGYDHKGAVYIIESYMYARTEIRDYLHDIQGMWHELVDALVQYEQIVQNNEWIKKHIVEAGGVRQIDSKQEAVLIELLTMNERHEEQAIRQFKKISERYPDLKRSTVPRWGTHTVR